MASHDAIALARRQLEHDRRSTLRYPGLFRHKLARMAPSPLAYLRGAAHLFYDLLRDRPDLAEGPRGKGWLVGDAHLENFGAYRIQPTGGPKGRRKDAVVFDLNDFDDAVQGPWRLDV